MALRRLGKRVQYLLNDLLVRNPLWQIFFLVAVSAVVVIAGMLLVRFHLNSGHEETTFWWSLTRLMDQGTFVDDHEDDPHTQAVAVFITLCGVLVMSTLIGTFSSKISQRLESLKRGRSPVVEKDHLIVCGSGDRLYEVTRELMEAWKDEPRSRRSRIVMLSENSREEMEEILTQRTGKKATRQVLCRTAEVTDIDSLRLGGFDRCRGFVITGGEDTAVLKTLIAVNSLCGKNRPVAVCEVRNTGMGEITRMAHPDVKWVPVREVVMRLLIQICRQPGLSAVYKEILSFSGNEFYFRKCPETEGLCFGEARSKLVTGIAVGMEKDGKAVINPPFGTVFGGSDSLLVLAEGPDKISFADVPAPFVHAAFKKTQSHGSLFKILVFSGHSTRFNLMLQLLERYSSGGTEILVAGSLPEEEGLRVTEAIKCSNCSVKYMKMDRTEPDEVMAISPGSFNSIVVVSGKKPGDSDEKADSECIVTLLILKQIRHSLGSSWKGTVVAEIRNPRNRKLASAAEIDDFVISNEVCSMIMAQLVKQKKLGAVYEEMFDPFGCEIQLRCPSQYHRGTFRDLEAQGILRNEIVLGWLTGTGSDALVTLNPSRELMMPENEDCRIIAISEE